MQLAKAAPSPEASKLATREEIQKRETDASKAQALAQKPAAPNESPVYQVFMPPLSYEASAKVQRDYDPKLIVLVRRVRVRPALIFRGRVEGDAVTVQNAASEQPNAAASAVPAKSPTPAPQNTESLFSRVRAFFHRLFS